MKRVTRWLICSALGLAVGYILAAGIVLVVMGRCFVNSQIGSC